MANNQGTHVPYVYLRVVFYLLKYISYCNNLHVIAYINPALSKDRSPPREQEKKKNSF